MRLKREPKPTRRVACVMGIGYFTDGCRMVLRFSNGEIQWLTKTKGGFDVELGDLIIVEELDGAFKGIVERGRRKP